jgi:hypothetical protein
MSRVMTDVHTGVNLGYRPPHHVADWCPTAAIVQDIVGEARREWVHQRLAAGALRTPVDRRLLASHLTPALRERLVARDPARLIAGEYLPPYRRGEHEVARVVVHTLPRIVYSVRARTVFDSREGLPMSEYRVVGEGDTTFVGPELRVAGTLPLYALIAFLDASRPAALQHERPRLLALPELLVLSRDPALARELQRFVRVESVVYPELQCYYRERLRRWVAAEFGRRDESTQFAAPLAEAMEQAWRPGV